MPIEKLAKIIVNSFEILGKQIKSLSEDIKKIKAPIVNVQTPIVRVPKIDIPEINIPEIKIPEIKAQKIEIPEIKIPEINIPEIDTSVIEELLAEFVNKETKIEFPKMDDIKVILKEILYKISEVKEEKVEIDYTELLIKIQEKINFEFDQKEFLDKLNEILKENFKVKFYGSNNGSPRYLANKLGALINPATEDKQDTIITELQYGTDRFWEEVGAGNVPGWSRVGVAGFNPQINSGEEELLWSQGGEYTDMSANTQLYISSTNASDTQTIHVQMLLQDISGNWNRVNAFGSLNGQNQVAISSQGIFVYAMIAISATRPLGKIYLAELSEGADLVAGVPQTQSKIKCVIPLDDKGLSYGSGYSGKYCTPSGVESYFSQLALNVEKAKSVKFFFGIKNTGVNYYTKNIPIIGYEQIPEYFNKGFFLAENQTYQWTAYSNDDNTNATFTNFIYEHTL